MKDDSDLSSFPLSPALPAAIQKVESMARLLCKVIAKPVFQCDSVQELATKSNVPFLGDDASKSFALFDVAYYLVRKKAFSQ